jgi:hypothetical protein
MIRSRWCFVGAETFTARLEYRKVSDLNIRYVTVWNICLDQAIYVANTQTDHDVSVDLERLFNG